MIYVLDTEHLVILQRRTQPAYRNLVNRLSAVDPAEVFASVVNFHEQMQGWLAYLNRARTASQIVLAYRELNELASSFCEMNTLPFNEAAQARFEDLRRQRIRIGTMDLRIATTALVNGATVLTANTVDFEKVPGLKFEDWTI